MLPEVRGDRGQLCQKILRNKVSSSSTCSLFILVVRLVFDCTSYFSIFHSHLLYCPLMVNCATKTNIQKIAVMQKRPSGASSTQNHTPILIPFFHPSRSSYTIKSSINLNSHSFIQSIINMPHLSTTSGKQTLNEIPPIPIPTIHPCQPNFL